MDINKSNQEPETITKKGYVESNHYKIKPILNLKHQLWN